MLLILVKWAVVFAVIAFVYREILSREKILNWWFKFGLRFEKRFFIARFGVVKNVLLDN